MSDLITPPLDRSRWLGHAYLIEGFCDGGALLVRVHHCIADGIALARVMLSLTDGAADAGIEPPPVHGGNGDMLRSARCCGRRSASAKRTGHSKGKRDRS